MGTRCAADRSLLPAAVEEVLRWLVEHHLQPAHGHRPTSSAAARRIRAGDKVVLWWQAANHDPDVFDDPRRFDIGRDPNPHLTFGHGSHFCLGANLARLEMRLVFEGLLDRVERVELDGPPERTRSNKHTGFRHLPVRFAPH